MSSLSLANGSVLDQFNVYGNGTINVTNPNGLTINGGGVNMNIPGTPYSFAAPWIYKLINYSGTIGGAGTSALSVLNTQANTPYTISTSGNSVNLTIGGFTPPTPPVINPVNPPSTLANNTYVLGLQPSLEWTPLTFNAGFEFAIPGWTAVNFNRSYSAPTISPTIRGEWPFTVPVRFNPVLPA